MLGGWSKVRSHQIFPSGYMMKRFSTPNELTLSRPIVKWEAFGNDLRNITVRRKQEGGMLGSRGLG